MTTQPSSPPSASYPLGLRITDAELRWPLLQGLHPLELRVLGCLGKREPPLEQFAASAFQLRRQLALPADPTEEAETLVRVACYGLIARLDSQVGDFLRDNAEPGLAVPDPGADARASAMHRWIEVLGRFTGAFRFEPGKSLPALDPESLHSPARPLTPQDRQRFVYGRLTRAAEILIGAGDRRRVRGRLQRYALRLSGEALMLAEIYFSEEQAQFVRLLWHAQDLRLGSQSIRLLRRLGYRGLSMVPTLRVPLEHPLGAAAKA